VCLAKRGVGLLRVVSGIDEVFGEAQHFSY